MGKKREKGAGRRAQGAGQKAVGCGRKAEGSGAEGSPSLEGLGVGKKRAKDGGGDLAICFFAEEFVPEAGYNIIEKISDEFWNNDKAVKKAPLASEVF